MADALTPQSLISQDAVGNAPAFFVDGNLGIATAFGVARVTLGAFRLNVEPGSEQPAMHPVVTIAVPEVALLQFANEIVERAKKIGVSLSEEIAE